jgi:hypothetical protein
LLPGLAIFALVAPMLIMRDAAKGWFHLIAPVCFGACSAFWYIQAVTAPSFSNDPNAVVLYWALCQASVPAVIAGLLAGSLAGILIAGLVRPVSLGGECAQPCAGQHSLLLLRGKEWSCDP